MCPPKISYEEEDPYAIGNYGKGVPLVHALLSVQEVTGPVTRVSYHQGGPVAIAVKGELCATRPIMPESPKQ